MKRTQTKSQTGVILSSAIYNSSSTLQEIKSLCAQTASVHMTAPSNHTRSHRASCFLSLLPPVVERGSCLKDVVKESTSSPCLRVN